MILVIGYGNPLRTDDALGQYVAWELKKHFDRDKLQVQIVYQLTPELAEIISHFDDVVFIDARVGDKPGEVVYETVRPLTRVGTFTHNVTPAALLGAANELYGRAPAAILISIVGAVFDYGTKLSPQLSRQMPTITDQAADIIEQHTKIQSLRESNHA